MGTHAAVRMLTAAGAEKALAVAVVDVAQNAAAAFRRCDAGAQTLAILGGVVASLRLLG